MISNLSAFISQPLKFRYLQISMLLNNATKFKCFQILMPTDFNVAPITTHQKFHSAQFSVLINLYTPVKKLQNPKFFLI